MDNDDIKQLLRVISFVKSLGGLYADIADDAKMELDKLLEANKILHKELNETPQNTNPYN